MRSEPNLRIGIDIGGTFTDFVIFSPATGELEAFKRLSTPENPAAAVLAGLEEYFSRVARSGDQAGLPEDQQPENVVMRSLQIVHGSTVATNALLERKGARTALVTTRGFRDVLQIGRQNR